MKTSYRLFSLIFALASPAAHGSLVLTYDAADLSPGSAVGQSWDPTGPADDPLFTAGFDSGTVVDTTGSLFARAISGGNTGNIGTLQAIANNVDFSYELWIRPADLIGDHNLFETGGATIGTSLTISGSSLQFTVRENGASNTVASTLTGLPSDFIQIVGVVDMGAVNDNTTVDDTLTLYLNGLPVDSNTFALGATIGANQGHFGGTDANIARADGFANPHAAYDGDLALARFYDNSLGDTEVLSLYGAVVPEPSSSLLIVLSASLLGCRRRRVA